MVPWWVLIHSGLHIMIWQMPVFVWLFNSLKEPLILVFLVFQIQKMSVPVLWKKSWNRRTADSGYFKTIEEPLVFMRATGSFMADFFDFFRKKKRESFL